MLRIGILLLLLVSCQKKDRVSFDFDEMMGKGTPIWNYLQTDEDFHELDWYRKAYAQREQKLFTKGWKIPKILHFIWLGPRPFPKESIGNLHSWIDKHPNWQVKFWTDRARPRFHPKVEFCEIDEETLKRMRNYYEATDNYAEKSDLLRYEVLYRQGGVYVDHDVTCYRSLEDLGPFSLICGLEPPHDAIISSAVSVVNNLIASVPGHPIFIDCMQKVDERWDELEMLYPGEENTAQRVGRRTFAAFDESIRECKNFDGIVLPSGFFNKIGNDQGFFAHHTYASTWFESEPVFEKNTRRRLMTLSKKCNQLLLLNGVTFFLILIVLSVALIRRRPSKN